MTKQEAKKRIEKLRKVIDHHRYLYHVLDRQEISDAALDSLKKELFDLEARYPELVTPDSPTQRVGGKPLDAFEKVRHRVPMLSLNDAFSLEDMRAWETRIKKLFSSGEKFDYFVELKMDGLAVSLVYKDGSLVQGATRGDGRIGEDVTANVKTIESIPLSLRDFFLKKQFPSEVIVRGEVYMRKDVFDKLNSQQRKKGLLPFANPRNAAAGSIRQLDPMLAAQRQLSFMAYDIATDIGQRSHAETHRFLQKLGFPAGDFTVLCKTLDEVMAVYERMKQRRERLPYWIDGVVVTVNQTLLYRNLGVVGKAPRGALALKFPAEQVTTTVEDIAVQVGRVGTLTPVALLAPVRVGGTTVSRATLHNIDEIKRLDLKIGDTVIIQKAGDIIPNVVKVLHALRTGKEKTFRMPATCPRCGAPVVRPTGEVNFYCSNKDCFAIQKEKIYHFVSKPAFHIDGLGPKIIDQLLEKGLIRDAVDLFDLKQGDLEPLEGFAPKSAAKLVAAIGAAKKVTLPRFIYALGIRHVGEQTAFLLARSFRSLDRIMSAGAEELLQVSDIGGVVARSIYDYFHDRANRAFIKKLLARGVTIEGERTAGPGRKWEGKTFVLTGTLQHLTRDEAKKLIRDRGGRVSSSVSTATDYVVAGKDPGSKYAKAEKVGVKVVGEREFLEMAGKRVKQGVRNKKL